MEKLKEKTKQVKGITLIALVVTIIVLLILAGVSISMLTGDKGILGQANNAKKQTEISSEKEAIQLTMINKEVSNNSKYDIGRKLYKKTLENSNIWDVIVINETQEKYDDGWRYIPKETEGEQNNDVNEVYNALKELEKENKFNDVSRYSDENIHISLYAGDRQQIYGSIDSVNKAAKLTTGSGPNPLDPDFLALLNKLSQILEGYKMLHY